MKAETDSMRWDIGVHVLFKMSYCHQSIVLQLKEDMEEG